MCRFAADLTGTISSLMCFSLSWKAFVKFWAIQIFKIYISLIPARSRPLLLPLLRHVWSLVYCSYMCRLHFVFANPRLVSPKVELLITNDWPLHVLVVTMSDKWRCAQADAATSHRCMAASIDTRTALSRFIDQLASLELVSHDNYFAPLFCIRLYVIQGCHSRIGLREMEDGGREGRRIKGEGGEEERKRGRKEGRERALVWLRIVNQEKAFFMWTAGGTCPA